MLDHGTDKREQQRITDPKRALREAVHEASEFVRKKKKFQFTTPSILKTALVKMISRETMKTKGGESKKVPDDTGYQAARYVLEKTEASYSDLFRRYLMIRGRVSGKESFKIRPELDTRNLYLLQQNDGEWVAGAPEDLTLDNRTQTEYRARTLHELLQAIIEKEGGTWGTADALESAINPPANQIRHEFGKKKLMPNDFFTYDNGIPYAIKRTPQWSKERQKDWEPTYRQ